VLSRVRFSEARRVSFSFFGPSGLERRSPTVIIFGRVEADRRERRIVGKPQQCGATLSLLELGEELLGGHGQGGGLAGLVQPEPVRPYELLVRLRQ